jgi:hypothetical protein
MSGFREGIVAALSVVALLAWYDGTVAAQSDDDALGQQEEALRQKLKSVLEELDDVRERRRAAGHRNRVPLPSGNKRPLPTRAPCRRSRCTTLQ